MTTLDLTINNYLIPQPPPPSPLATMRASSLFSYGLSAVAAVGQVSAEASSGCSAAQDGLKRDNTLNVTLGDRRYLLYIPEDYDPETPAPLVLSYHGGTRTAEIQQALDLLSTPYFNKDHIIVYPSGINVSWLVFT